MRSEFILLIKVQLSACCLPALLIFKGSPFPEGCSCALRTHLSGSQLACGLNELCGIDILTTHSPLHEPGGQWGC